MFNQLIPKLLSHKNIAVFSHVRPDGDCLGAQTALSLWLQKNGVEVSAFNEDDVPENLSWLTDFFPIQKPTNLENFDAFVVVDGNALHRFGDEAEKIADLDKPVYMIDHHPDPEDVFEEFVSREESSSTCELIYQLYEEYDIEQVDAAAAKAMFTGIVTDTGSFQFDSVSSETMRAGSELLRRGGFTPNEIAERLYASRPLRQLKLLSMALETITLHAGGDFSTISITQKMLEDTGCTKEDTEGFVQYPLSVEGVKACVLLREDGDRIKLSLRSQSPVDVNKWARQFNGGGHKKAAGAWHPGPLNKAIEEVIAVGKEQLDSEA
ncbi:DHH family phosphoesterase [Gracilimonas mengyeensis]|uniref:Phosphoesterase RecJ domain-containing protein n=1 Tax=Gracilimonas mengyeensis TaxID=1302730 RepID=A0A521DFF8_9BACT|nr:bifunctional oligoribonuclease/PAP phosphatase NrnA [Gracilimonas mengyeensis]SMO69871.1 phosphoesterase RecJ domain-containing protein [Gracilimonas mengyeensis]